MTTVEQVAAIARNYLRDFPRFFQVSFPTAGRTFEIGHQNIDASTVWVAYSSGATGASATGASTVAASAYSMDARNGIIRFNTAVPQGSTVLLEGYYYEWLLPSDLNFYAQMAINFNTHNIDTPVEQMAPAVFDVIGMSCLVEALWGLTTEFSRDIDVMTSESIHIPASQRFRMVQSLLQFWMSEYEKKAKALNIGLERIEVFTLRRQSRTTNRLVPIYRSKELGDFAPMERLWVPIDSGEIHIEEPTDDLREDVYVDMEPPSNITATSGQLFY
jgi:hypothetical protein